MRLAVAGGGVVGLSIAVQAVQSGAEVSVFEPRPLGDNASGVAAGMLAPALEAALEDDGAALYDLYRRSYAAWPAFAETCGIAPCPQLGGGALYVGDAAELTALEVRLSALGAQVEALDATEARVRQPLHDGAEDALWVASDGRVDPAVVLARLRAAFEAAGGRWRAQRLSPTDETSSFDAVVLAAGFESTAWSERVPELTALSPIKGHILRYPLRSAGPTLRSREGYVTPLHTSVAFGASMETGRSDARLNLAVVETLHGRAAKLAPALGGLRYEARAGVRAATPDHAPMVGRTQSGVFVATGARRNGWLLTPVVVKAALAALEGAAPDPIFDPARFTA